MHFRTYPWQQAFKGWLTTSLHEGRQELMKASYDTEHLTRGSNRTLLIVAPVSFGR